MNLLEKIEETSKIITIVSDLIEDISTKTYIDRSIDIQVKNKVSGKVLFDGVVPDISPRSSMLNWVDLNIGSTNNVIIIDYMHENDEELPYIETVCLTCVYDCYEGIRSFKYNQLVKTLTDESIIGRRIICSVDIEKDNFSYNVI